MSHLCYFLKKGEYSKDKKKSIILIIALLAGDCTRFQWFVQPLFSCIAGPHAYVSLLYISRVLWQSNYVINKVLVY